MGIFKFLFDNKPSKVIEDDTKVKDLIDDY